MLTKIDYLKLFHEEDLCFHAEKESLHWIYHFLMSSAYKRKIKINIKFMKFLQDVLRHSMIKFTECYWQVLKIVETDIEPVSASFDQYYQKASGLNV